MEQSNDALQQLRGSRENNYYISLLIKQLRSSVECPVPEIRGSLATNFIRLAPDQFPRGCCSRRNHRGFMDPHQILNKRPVENAFGTVETRSSNGSGPTSPRPDTLKNNRARSAVEKNRFPNALPSGLVANDHWNH
jgi:hypothetical protein